MRRQYKRIPCKGDGIRVEIVTETEAQVSDISRQGIGVKAPKRVMPGTPCTVTIGTDGSLVSLRGKSVWERFAGYSINSHGDFDGLFSAGIRLEEAPEDLMTSICSGGCAGAEAVRVKPSRMNVFLIYTESLPVINLSYGGLLTESWNSWEYGTEIIARLFLPDSHGPVKCLGRVTSCQQVNHGAEKKYHVGFEIIAMDDGHARLLRAFIQMRSVM
ncbi:MAG: PilZ domain-containing protein [Nitrospirota bacterium]|nr:PilZ domain-containing protein [Nitrospirota bacterium]